MRVLLFGANGQVGRECAQQFSSQCWTLYALTRNDADFTESDAVYSVVKKIAPDVVVNACAYTAVDKAENEPELAHKVNADSVGALAKASAELDIPTLHISTDYVFDGDGSTPYLEDNTVSPLGVYGQTKLAGEQQLQYNNPKLVPR